MDNLLKYDLSSGTEGLYGSDSYVAVPQGYLIEAQDITFDYGSPRRDGGASKYNASAISGTPSIIAGTDWWADASTQRTVVVGDDGKIYKGASGSFSTTLKSGLTLTSVRPTFSAALYSSQRELFIFLGSAAQLQVLVGDGTTTADVAYPPTDWTSHYPTGGFQHVGRMFAFGNSNDPHRLYYTPTDSHEDFTGTDSGTLAVYPNEGDGIVAGVSMLNQAILFKQPRGIYIGNMASSDTTEWQIQKLNGALGIAGPYAYCFVDNSLVFLGADANIYQVSAISQFSVASMSLTRIALMNAWIRRNIDFTQLQDAHMEYYPVKREVHITLSSVGGTLNDRRLIIDVDRSDQNGAPIPRFRYSSRDTNRSLWIQRDSDGIERPFIGDTAGVVWQLDTTARDKAGAGYSMVMRTPNDNFSAMDPRLAYVNKNARFLELVAQTDASATVTAKLYYENALFETVTFAVVSGTYVYKQRVTGSARFISVELSNATADADLRIFRLTLYFSVGNLKLD